MAEDLTLLKSDEACIVRNPLAFSYGETELERTSFVAGDTISVAGRYFSGQSCNLWLVRCSFKACQAGLAVPALPSMHSAYNLSNLSSKKISS